MKVRNIPLTLLKIENKSGTGKVSGKPYNFFTASVVDDDANVFQLNLADDVAGMLGEAGLKARNQAVTADIEFKPKGFDIGGTLIAFSPAKA